MSTLALWEKICPILIDKIGQSAYETWFSSIRIKERPPQTLILETPDDFFKNWILEHYLPIITGILTTIADQRRLEILVTANAPAAFPVSEKPSAPPNITVEKQPVSYLNPRFSFDNFVVGPSNRFAYSACMAVADSPGKAYNPLFIYGRVGLGKTHLMQAITHKILAHYQSCQCCYLSAERFTNELIDAIQHRSTAGFRKKYRNIDVLLIDDVHFLAGKESTQEEFFHTFNALHNSRKQIIFSSDRPPKEIAKLEERLRSRFAWGLITDIQPPDFETRVAILRKKIEREPVDVPENVLVFIAEQIKSNIRELEGALIRVLAYSLLEEKRISLEMAHLVLRDMVQETSKDISVETIQKAVAEFFNISCSDLKARRRVQTVILPRQVAMYLSRKLTRLSLPEIGTAFGGKDHTTVLHAYKKIEGSLEKDTQLKKTVEKLITAVQQDT